MKVIDEKFEYEYTSSVESSLAVVQAMAEIKWWENMKILMPLLAKELSRRGCIFPKAENK